MHWWQHEIVTLLASRRKQYGVLLQNIMTTHYSLVRAFRISESTRSENTFLTEKGEQCFAWSLNFVRVRSAFHSEEGKGC